MTTRLLWRVAPLLVGIVLLLGATVLVASHTPLPFWLRATPTGLDLGGTPAPNFQLTDQNGHAVALADLRGKLVVLTFLYTTCPDVCPIIAGKLGQVHDQLGAQANDVAFVAITVDPDHDTPARLRQYLAVQHLQNKLIFLTGDRAALAPIWAAYYIGAQPGQATATGGPVVLHTDSLFLIDRHGREQRLLHADFDPRVLRQDLAQLLAMPPVQAQQANSGAGPLPGTDRSAALASPAGSAAARRMAVGRVAMRARS